MIKLTSTLISLVFIAALGLPVLSVSAQDGDDACTQLVADALELSQEACAETGRNQACYGNIVLAAEPQPGITNLEFEERGDITDIEVVRSLQLSSMNDETAEWGVAYLQLQANIPDDSLENITLLLFGDVAIENAVEPAPDPTTIEVTPTSNVNVRGGPSTNDTVVGSLAFGEIAVADGRLEDSSWVRIRLEEDTVGWIYTQLITSSTDIEALDILTAEGGLPEPTLSSMQAFFVETGVDDAPCKAAPDSGILVQTPEGIAEINLIVNEVDIRLRSTAYIQSQLNVEMTVTIIEGSARVTAQGQSVSIPAGTLVRIPMDANNQADGPPSDPEAYDELAFAALPVSSLPRFIAIAPGLTEEELAEATATIDGEWVLAGEPSFTCRELGAYRAESLMLTAQENSDIRGQWLGDLSSFSSDPARAQEMAFFTATPMDEENYFVSYDLAPFGSAWEARLHIIDTNYIEYTEIVTWPDGCIETILYVFEPVS